MTFWIQRGKQQNQMGILIQIKKIEKE